VDRGTQAKKPRIIVKPAENVGRRRNPSEYGGIESIVDPGGHVPAISLRRVLNIEVYEVVGLLLDLIARIEEEAAVVIERGGRRDSAGADGKYAMARPLAVKCKAVTLLSDLRKPAAEGQIRGATGDVRLD
jgi:hypothetical protein